jgi:hypothetical protein
MATNTRQLIDRIETIIRAWTNLRPEKSFAGMTLEQFKEAVKPSLDSRNRLVDLDGQTRAELANRTVVDTASTAIVTRMIRGVQADVEEGEGKLYAAMGFVPKSQRSVGRRTKIVVKSEETSV